jgi:hypothetical protein
MASNNPDMLSLGDQDLTGHDIYAIAERFYYVAVTQQAREYLMQINSSGRKTVDWVEGKQLAAHALWLRDNRQVKRGPRWVVSGDAASLAKRLILNARIPAAVCEFIAKHLSTPNPKGIVDQSRTILVGNGKLLVSSDGLAAHWKLYVLSDYNPPPTAKIGRALMNISMSETVKVRIPGRTESKIYREVDPEFVCAWIEDVGIGDADEIRAKIKQSNPDYASIFSKGSTSL